LHEVHAVRGEAAQRRLEWGAWIVARADLGGDRHPLAHGSERAAQQSLGLAVTVRRRGVEERDAPLDGAPDRGLALVRVVWRPPARAAHRPAPEPQSRLRAQETRKGPEIGPGPLLHPAALRQE